MSGGRSEEKRRAYSILRSALLRREIERPFECEQCGRDKETPHGHHDDYSKPLAVRWLCPRCHRRHHEGCPPILKPQPAA